MTDRIGEFAARLSLPAEDVAAALAAQRSSLPWYAEAIAAIGGWLAALILTIAVAALVGGVTESELLLGVLGAGLTAAAAFAHRKATGAFGHQFTLALMLAGQSLMVGSVAVSTESVTAAAIAAVVLALVLVPLVPDRMHQFVTVAAAALMSLAALMMDGGTGGAQIFALLTVPAGVALLLYPTRPLDSRPAAFVLLLAGPVCDVLASFAADTGLFLWTGWGGRLAYLIGLGWPLALLWRQAGRHGRLLAAGVAAVGLTAALLLPAGLVAGLMFMVLAFAIGSRLLAGLGVAVEIVVMTRFYYDLQFDLLAKSVLLAVVGGVLLALWLAWRRLTAAEARP